MRKTTRVFEGNFVHVDRVETDRKRADEIVGTRGGQFSVCVLVYDPRREKVYLVSQTRTAMRTQTNPEGVIIEAVAGRCDAQNESPAKTMARELLEELGISVSEADVQTVAQKAQALSPGVLVEWMFLGFVELKSGCEVDEGGQFGLKHEGEVTSVVVLSVNDLNHFATYVCEDIKTFALIQWFRNYLREKELEDRILNLRSRLNESIQ